MGTPNSCLAVDCSGLFSSVPFFWRSGLPILVNATYGLSFLVFQVHDQDHDCVKMGQSKLIVTLGMPSLTDQSAVTCDLLNQRMRRICQRTV